MGLMSGSSLDGLDIALLHFPTNFYESKSWQLIKSETISYSEDWIKKLKLSSKADQYSIIDQNFGSYLGELISPFLKSFHRQPELIAVHGHTMYHAPSEGISVQLGAAQSIANYTGIPAMDDFRTQDIILGGQGAPIAPTVEHWLYPDHKVFLNIGGIVNISVHGSNGISAFDIGPGNQLLNALSMEIGKPYDENGAIAMQGTVIESLLNEGKKNQFYHQAFPKSLSNQWVQEEVIPIFKNSNHTLSDRMATAIAMIAWTLENALNQLNLSEKNILITGGGAYNNALIKNMQSAIHSKKNHLVIPDDDTINYKEASLMALMGYLNITGSNNIFGHSTGSKINHCAGNLCVPKSLLLL